MRFLLTFLILLQVTLAGAIIRVPNTDWNRKIMQRLDLDHGCMGHSREFLHFHLNQDSELRLSENQALSKALMKQSKIIIDDVDSQFSPFITEDDLGIYHTVTEMDDALLDATQRFPDLTNLIEAGVTHEGRIIYALEVSNKASAAEKVNFLVTGTHHAREWISAEVPLGIIKDLLTNFESDSEVKKILNQSRIVVIPMLNKDGAHYSRTRQKMWRKNRRPAESGKGVGVDNNRNYAYKWGVSGASSYPWSDTYKGPEAMSEIENQVIQNLQDQYQFVAALSFHSYSELVLWPWSYTDAIQSKDHSVFEYYGKQLAKILNYRPMQSADLYPAAGDSDDYLYAMHGVLAYTIELGRRFVPKESEVPVIIANNNKAARWFFQNARKPFDHISETPIRRAQHLIEQIVYSMHQTDVNVDLNDLLKTMNQFPKDLISEAMRGLNIKEVWRFRLNKALLKNKRSNQLQH